jgi:Putative abortive phage resistance protein AbiGi, antitoxin
MACTRYSQLHRRLLFHWTGPRPLVPVRSGSDREAYINLLCDILQSGLRFSQPNITNTEWIEKDEIRALHPMLCFSEWGVAESRSHSGRYGLMGLGFTRKFVMNAGGRPVVYIPNKRSDPFRRSLIDIIRFIRNNPHAEKKLLSHVDFVSSYLKSYHFKRTTAKSAEKFGKVKRSLKTKSSTSQKNHLSLDFGGILANLEDREWRVLLNTPKAQSDHLAFQAGELAMIVFPDHETLSLAMRNDVIMNWMSNPDMPSVCMVSREVIQSI